MANDLHNKEQVALKVLHAHLADEPGAIARLRREVEVARHIDHPGALVCRGLHDLDGVLALSMPVHRGGSLAEHVQTQGPWTHDALVRLGVELADVLAAAHRAGVLHRDVTTTNVLVEQDGTARLSDFGLARVGGRQTRTVHATPGFAAPEVLEGRSPDHRADLYGLGAVLYVAATGSAPFAASSAGATLRRQLDGDHQALSSARSDLPTALTTTVDALLHPDPAKRPSSAQEVMAMLRGRRAPPAMLSTDLVAQLKPGVHDVVVHERRTDQARRRRLRQRRSWREHPVGWGADALLERARSAAANWLPIERAVPREQQLVELVATAAELPADALVVPEEVYDEGFVLVSGVSADVAASLASSVRSIGFDAKTDATVEETVDQMRVFVGAGALLCAAALFKPILAVFVALVLAPVIARLVEPRTLPVLFKADLTAAVSPEYRARLTAPTALPDAGPAPVGLVEQATQEVGALLVVLERTDLAPTLQSDLKRHATGLQRELQRCASSLKALESTSTRSKALAAEDAVERVQARIRRMETLQRGGSAVDDDELAAMRASVQAHLDVLAKADEDEARHVRLLARVLDIGAAATEARHQLADQDDDDTVDVVNALRDVVRMGRSTEEELRRPRPRMQRT